MENLISTTMNVIAFAYIGLLIWLYVKPENDDGDDG